MCGIAGFTFSDREKIKRMVGEIGHRGPDGNGFFVDDEISFGHSRLSILDLSDAANQPFISEDGKIAITFNGEIYNFKELKEDLIEKSYKFKSTGDTEVILNGYREYGVDFFTKMRGMWAFAIYDKDKNVVILSRDNFGIKPLYYSEDAGKLIFCSELKGLEAVVSNLSPNRDHYSFYFNMGYFCAPHTCYREIKKLEPGSILTWDIGAKRGVKESQTFFKQKFGDNYESSFEEAVELVNESLLDSVEAHYVSDVPVALLLSGGTDSSLLAALSVKLGKKPEVYNLDTRNNVDAQYAKKVSDCLGLDLTSIEMDDSLLIEQYEKIWDIIDEPTADVSVIPTSLIFSQIKGHSKVVLSGEGGDELFGGYMRHLKMARHNKIVKNNAIFNLFNLFSQGTSSDALEYLNPILKRVRNFSVDDLMDDVIGSYTINTRVIDFPIEYKKLHNFLFGFFQTFGLSSSPNLFFDRFAYLPNNLMYKNDISSMASSIESRVPLLDIYFFKDILSRIKPEYCLSKNYKDKILLKKVLEKYIPKELVYRPKKGFSFSFDKYPVETFRNDAKKAAEFHIKNAEDFVLGKSTCNLISEKNIELLIKKYPRFVFALVTNWKKFIKNS